MGKKRVHAKKECPSCHANVRVERFGNHKCKRKLNPDMTCPICGKPIQSKNKARHMNRQHNVKATVNPFLAVWQSPAVLHRLLGWQDDVNSQKKAPCLKIKGEMDSDDDDGSRASLDDIPCSCSLTGPVEKKCQFCPITYQKKRNLAIEIYREALACTPHNLRVRERSKL